MTFSAGNFLSKDKKYERDSKSEAAAGGFSNQEETFTDHFLAAKTEHDDPRGSYLQHGGNQHSYYKYK